MNRKRELAQHVVLASVMGKIWDCGCETCVIAREEGFNPTTIDSRTELIALLDLLGDELQEFVSILSDTAVINLIAKKRQQLLCQLEFEESLIIKASQEPHEKCYTDQPMTNFQGTGGGKRIIRSGKGMS